MITLNKSRYSFNENTLFCVLSVIIFCAVFTICATTSPLFAFCEESHCFFSVGKAILHGRVLYRDILEQKGLLIYLIQIPAYLISHTTFLGVWIIQTILMAITAFFGYKTALEAKLSPLLSFLSVAAFSLIAFTSYSLSSSQIVELYALPCFTVSIYSVYKYLGKRNDMPLKTLFLNGILAGIIFWMKYSLLGFYFAMMVVICIRSLCKKDFFKAIKSAIAFLLGMIAVSVPCVLYFAVNNSLGELVKYYFINNVSEYGEKITLSGLLNSYEWSFFHQYDLSKVMFVAIIISAVLILFCKVPVSLKIMFYSCLIVQFGTVYLHGAMMSYYFFAFASFALIGILAFFSVIQKLSGKICIKAGLRKTCLALCILAAFAGSVYIGINNQPRPARFLEKPDRLAQYQFAEYMHQKYKLPTLLDFNELDGGFYTAADITPTTWAYCALNWNNPQMDKDRLETVKNKKVDFVVLRVKGSVTFNAADWPNELTDNYAVAKRIEQYRVDDLYTYFLLEKK